MILNKLGDEYKLYSHDSCIATTHESPYKKLSLKNCQAIENGYDLDELADEYYKRLELVPHKGNAYISGFKKALEILRDKKYDETDLYRAFLINSAGNNTTLRNFFKQTVLPMFQDNEWEVDIETILIQSSIEGEPIWQPKLDANGYLILKRK